MCGAGVARAWLGELSGDSANFYNRYTHRIGEHHCHLQNNAQLLANIYRRELFETFGAVASLQ